MVGWWLALWVWTAWCGRLGVDGLGVDGLGVDGLSVDGLGVDGLVLVVDGRVYLVGAWYGGLYIAQAAVIYSLEQ
jgi:hypothetical protein